MDNGNYENASLEFYHKLVTDLKSTSDKPGPKFDTKEELFDLMHTKYLCNGLSSLKKIPSSSVDFIFSQAVLEHVFRDEFEAIMSEFWRILKPSGLMSHVFDFKDHIESSLNNLRFSSSFWESGLVRKSLAYTNRFRPSEIVDLISKSGFEQVSEDRDRWEKLPLEISKFHKDFKKFSSDDFLTNGMTLVSRKPSSLA